MTEGETRQDRNKLLFVFTYRQYVKGLLVLHTTVALSPSADVKFLGYTSTTCP